MTAIANHLEDRILNYFIRNVADTKPTSLLVGLWTADPTDSGAGAGEVSGGSYARASVPLTNFGVPSNGVSTTQVAITFPTASAPWGTVTHIVIMDQLNNPFFVGALSVSKTVGTGDTFSIPIGQLTITIA